MKLNLMAKSSKNNNHPRTKTEFIYLDHNIMDPLLKNALLREEKEAAFLKLLLGNFKTKKTKLRFVLSPLLTLENVGIDAQKLNLPPTPQFKKSDFGDIWQYLIALENHAFQHYSKLPELQSEFIEANYRNQSKLFSKSEFSVDLSQNIQQTLNDPKFIQVLCRLIANRYTQQRDLFAGDFLSVAPLIILHSLHKLAKGEVTSAYLCAHNLYLSSRDQNHPIHLKELLTQYNMPSFKTRADLVDGEIISYAVTGFPSHFSKILKRVNIFTTDSPSVIEKRLHLMKGTIGLSIKLNFTQMTGQKISLAPGSVYCLDKDNFKLIRKINVSQIPDWSKFSKLKKQGSLKTIK